MNAVCNWTRNGLALIGVLAMGFWLGSSRTVRASSYGSNSGDLEFQMTSINPASTLLVYEPSSKILYVYQGATTGNSALQCSFKYQMDRPGEVIHRIPCDLPKFMP